MTIDGSIEVLNENLDYIYLQKCDSRVLFHKTSLPKKPGLFQLVGLILNQINW